METDGRGMGISMQLRLGCGVVHGVAEPCGKRKPLAWSVCIKVGLVVLLIQVVTLLIFTSGSMSRELKLTTPVQQDIRDSEHNSHPQNSADSAPSDVTEEFEQMDRLDDPNPQRLTHDGVNSDEVIQDRSDGNLSSVKAVDTAVSQHVLHGDGQIVTGDRHLLRPDEFNIYQIDRPDSRNPNSPYSAGSENVHRQQVDLSQNSQENQHVVNQKQGSFQVQPLQQTLEKRTVTTTTPDPYLKRSFEHASNRLPNDMNGQPYLSHIQNTPREKSQNINRTQDSSLKKEPVVTWDNLKRPDNADDIPSGVETKKRKFYVYLLNSRPKALLSPGCPDRGFGGRVTSLAFVKVHKSASTTVANILARYALRYSLNVALPWKMPRTARFNYFEPKITVRQVLPAPRGQHYQVVFNHMIFHREELEALMPDRTFYFAIMRNPLDRFVSSFVYYGYDKLFLRLPRFSTVKDAVLYFMQHPHVVKNYIKPELYNSLAGDTGLAPSLQTDVQAVRAHIARVERDLDLIMIVEYFDESLVLLKRRSCLSMQDIVYLMKNARRPEELPEVRLTQEEKAMFDRFQMADDLMYRHFYSTFWELVHAEGPGFFSEVRQFKEIQRTVRNFCSSVGSVWDFVVVPQSPWNEEFMVTAKDCRLMAVSELDMQTYLISRAVKLYMMSAGNPDFVI
ncbi:uncharacterized protein LOC143277055 [Babylonia areolata]|uniref:uncharacterized protein LOC143277055 n=1 Tax=Babylonia areolata TaxID=304850 RepID=UPI003FCF31CE